jgi:acetyltransferase-like isoleucine patch superfamily enzyme
MAVPLMAWIRDKLALSVVCTLHRQLLIRFWKMDIGEGSIVSRSAKLDKTNPRGVHIGKYTAVAFGAAILTHDWVNNCHRAVHVGDNCFIGAHAIILPGVTIGDHCIVSAASVVARDIPAGSLVAGNPARVVEKNVNTTRYGVRRSQAD